MELLGCRVYQTPKARSSGSRSDGRAGGATQRGSSRPRARSAPERRSGRPAGLKVEAYRGAEGDSKLLGIREEPLDRTNTRSNSEVLGQRRTCRPRRG